MIKIYHNPRCSKSRAGLEYLKAKNIEHKVVEYLKEPFTIQQLSELISKTGKEPFQMVRTHEDLYKANFRGKEFSNQEWIEILVENPRLIHRPIIENGEKAVWGQPVEEINSVL